MPKSQQASISPPFVASVVTNTQNFDEILQFFHPCMEQGSTKKSLPKTQPLCNSNQKQE